jgi:hypothetical protein
VVKKVMFSLHFSSPPCCVPTLLVALREAGDVADNVPGRGAGEGHELRCCDWVGGWQLAGRGGAGGAARAGLGRVCWAGRSGDVPWWTVAVFEPNSLCQFRVKNTRWPGVASRL